MDREKQIKQEIREHWFKDHKAELIDCGDIKILNWKNPNSGSYYVRYVFDGCNLYIAGDIGEAVFNLTWKAHIHSFNDLYIGYFLEKMSTCSNGKHEYDGDAAAQRLKEWKIELLEDKEFVDDEEKDEFIETIDEIISAAENSQSEEQWAWEYVNGEFSEFISDNEPDYWEWMYKAGNVIPYHNYAFLEGLKMASEQLKGLEG